VDAFRLIGHGNEFFYTAVVDGQLFISYQNKMKYALRLSQLRFYFISVFQLLK
jgi:hypothetical protein